jgi:hypothetical protein
MGKMGKNSSRLRLAWYGLSEDLHFVNGPIQAIYLSSLGDFQKLGFGGREGNVGHGVLAHAYGQGLGPFFAIHG